MVNNLNIIKDYYVPRMIHMCRFCKTPIARLVGKDLQPLANKIHVNFLLESGAFFRINCCKSCSEKIDFALHAKEIYQADRQYNESDPVVEGFYVIEDNKFTVAKLEKERKRFLNARKL